MSSRGQFVGTGPQAGGYVPKTTPADPENIPVYLNDELLNLGGRLNDVLEGGAFPPQSELPVRVKEGMMIFFTQPIKNPRYVLNPFNTKQEDEYIITSSGIWLYKGGKWLKIIDDPSALRQTLHVYKLVGKDQPAPKKPPNDKYLETDLEGWVYQPAESTDLYTQWLSTAPNAFIGDPPNVKWAEPVKYNNQGAAGQEGASVEFRYFASTVTPVITDKKARVPTTGGKAWSLDIPPVSHPDGNYIWSTFVKLRGDELLTDWFDPVKYSTPETTQSAEAFSKSAQGSSYPSFDPDSPGLPGPSWSRTPPSLQSGDILWMTTRLEWTDGAKQTNWVTPFRFNGEEGVPGAGFYTIVDNSVTSWPSNASARFKTHTGRDPKLDDILTFSNTVGRPVLTRRFNGSTWIQPSAMFNGDVIATGTIAGDRITAGTSISAPVINGGIIKAISFQGSNVLSTGSITGGTIIGTQINNGNKTFYVDANGNMTCKNAVITGSVTATSGTIGGIGIVNGVLKVPAANITGKLTAGQIETDSFILAGQTFMLRKFYNPSTSVTVQNGTTNIMSFNVDIGKKSARTGLEITSEISCEAIPCSPTGSGTLQLLVNNVVVASHTLTVLASGGGEYCCQMHDGQCDKWCNYPVTRSIDLTIRRTMTVPASRVKEGVNTIVTRFVLNGASGSKTTTDRNCTVDLIEEIV